MFLTGKILNLEVMNHVGITQTSASIVSTLIFLVPITIVAAAVAASGSASAANSGSCHRDW